MEMETNKTRWLVQLDQRTYTDTAVRVTNETISSSI